VPGASIARISEGSDYDGRDATEAERVTVPFRDAFAAAEMLRAHLIDYCQRIEVAGSLRRRKAAVKDIELVAIPTFREEAEGLWGETVKVDLLEQRIAALYADGLLALRDVEVHRQDGSIEHQQRNGRSYKALEFEGVPVDLFIVHPGEADWGVIYAIRTGPGDWNQRIVTDCQRFLRRVEGGRVYHSGQYIPCPEEPDFFRAVGQEWIEPHERTADKVRIMARATR
jgi:DNA polymerase/3'-5' exonuclease PolX